jgi:hypothetical protein
MDFIIFIVGNLEGDVSNLWILESSVERQIQSIYIQVGFFIYNEGWFKQIASAQNQVRYLGYSWPREMSKDFFISLKYKLHFHMNTQTLLNLSCKYCLWWQ